MTDGPGTEPTDAVTRGAGDLTIVSLQGRVATVSDLHFDAL